VYINPRLETVVLDPPQGAVKISLLALDIRISWEGIKCPVSNWDSHKVEAPFSNLLDISLSDPSIPVLAELLLSVILAPCLREMILVYRNCI
jgi:hypothetical protein